MGMTTREKVEVYAAHGGAWNHLERELINEGVSETFAKDFVRTFRKNLGKDNSETALKVYEQWSSCDKKEECETFLKLKYITR